MGATLDRSDKMAESAAKAKFWGEKRKREIFQKTGPAGRDDLVFKVRGGGGGHKGEQNV